MYVTRIHSNDDPCISHQVLGAVSRFHSFANDFNRCDNNLHAGWYKFMAGNQPTVIPTKCLQNNVCGTQLPMRIDLGEESLPTNGSTLETYACTSYNVLGRWDCCVLRQRAIIKNCGDFYVYHLLPTDRCPVAYCAEDPDLDEYQNIVVKRGEVAPPIPAAPTPSPQVESTTQADTTVSISPSVTPAIPLASTAENIAESTTENLINTESIETTSSDTTRIPPTTNMMTSSIIDETTQNVGVNVTEGSVPETSPTVDVSTSNSVSKSSTNETNVLLNTTVTMENVPTIGENVTITTEVVPNSSDYNTATDVTTDLVNGSESTTIQQNNISMPCQHWQSTPCPDGNTICYIDPDLETLSVPCDNGNVCGIICNAYPECDDQTDERSELCPIACSEGRILCSNGINCYSRCDGIKECFNPSLNEDENNCPGQINPTTTEDHTLTNLENDTSITAAPANQTVSIISSTDKQSNNDSTEYQTTTDTAMINETSPSASDELSTLYNVDNQTNADILSRVQSTPVVVITGDTTSLDVSTEGQTVDNASTIGQATFNTTTPEADYKTAQNTDNNATSDLTTPSVMTANTATSTVTPADDTTSDIQTDNQAHGNTTLETTTSVMISEETAASSSVDDSNTSITNQPLSESTVLSNETMSTSSTTEISEESQSPSTPTLSTQTSTSLVDQTTNISVLQTSLSTTTASLITLIETTNAMTSVDSSTEIRTTVKQDVGTSSLLRTTSESQQVDTTIYSVNEPSSPTLDTISSEDTTIDETSSDSVATGETGDISSVTQQVTESRVAYTTMRVSTILSTLSEGLSTFTQSSTQDLHDSSPTSHPETITSPQETVSVKETTTTSRSITSPSDKSVITSSSPRVESGTIQSGQVEATTSLSSLSTTTLSSKSDQDTNLSPLPVTTSNVPLTSSSMSHVQTNTDLTAETTELPTGQSNVTYTTDITISDDKPLDDDKKGLIHDNFGLFVFIVVASGCLVAIFLFGIIGHMYRLRRLRTWTPRMAYQDAYADMEKKTLSFRSDFSGIDSPIPDIDIMHDEKVKEEETSLSQASTIALGPTPGHPSGFTNGHQDMTSSRSLKYDESYIQPEVGETNKGFVDDNTDGVVPYEEIDNEYPRSLFPWIENAEDTKL
ncbi:hypothetical protein ACF0H5_014455 [Mactra antiquata]